MNVCAFILAVIATTAVNGQHVCPVCTDGYDPTSCTSTVGCHGFRDICELQVHLADNNRVEYQCHNSHLCQNDASVTCSIDTHETCSYCCNTLEDCRVQREDLFSTTYTLATAAPTTTTTTAAPSTTTRTPTTSQDSMANPIVIGGDCKYASTSEGIRTLKHGDTACAPLLATETEADKGKRYIVCHDSVTDTLSCPAGLRFDTSLGNCNWPDEATCELGDDIPVPSSTTSSGTTVTPTLDSTDDPVTPGPDAPTLTGPCNAINCQLPNCFCYGNSPTSIPEADMPQFIMLTFDDTVSPQFWNSYFRALLYDNDFMLFNPTGCPIKTALFVSHENTDYSKVKALWDKGHEIASHTIIHDLPDGSTNADYPEMVAQIQGLKDEVLKATGSQALVDSIVGFRAPYLRVAHDTMYRVLRDYGFYYDSSILNLLIWQGKQPAWPFTLDYVLSYCENPPCPTKSFPGMWQVPLNGWIGDDGQSCSMADACVIGSSQWSATEQEWYQYFKRNFENYFYPIKVPLPVFIHGWMFINYPNSWPALTSWLQDTLQAHQNVWMVTPLQVIEWMKNPLSHDQMIAQNWGC